MRKLHVHVYIENGLTTYGAIVCDMLACFNFMVKKPGLNLCVCVLGGVVVVVFV